MTIDVTYHEVMQTVRNGRCTMAKKTNHPRLRVGIYGPTLDMAVDRIAEKLKISFGAVKPYVNKLMERGKLVFVSGRLVATRGYDQQHKAHRSLVAPAKDIEIVASDPDWAWPADASDIDPHTRKAWDDLFQDEHVSGGDHFRRAIWGNGMVPVTA